MEDKFKTRWLIMHIACIIIMVLCLWRSKELFQEPVRASGNINEQTSTDGTNGNGTTIDLNITPSIIESPSEEGQNYEDGEKAETIQDQIETDENIQGGQSAEGGQTVGDGNYTTPTPTGEVIVTPGAVVTPSGNASITPGGEVVIAPSGEVSVTPGGELVVTPSGETSQDQDDKVQILKKFAELRQSISAKIEAGEYKLLDNTQHDWWFIRKTNHVPSGSGAEISINQYSAFYRNEKVTDEDKVIYLTFDCGYEIGCTPLILDTLAKHKAQAMFFVTKAFIEKNPELVKRMKEEGHLVGNHTLNHPVMPTKDVSTLLDELVGCAELFYNTTGYELDPFMRPPTGAYSERTLQLTKDLGYATIFWSIAYKDYDTKNQPGKDFVIDHFNTYYHNGAIPLIHNTSTSNTEALDEVLALLEDAGYRFGSLYELLEME